MALEDLKSSLNKGAGKPNSSPSGRHTKSPVNINTIDKLAKYLILLTNIIKTPPSNYLLK